LADSSRCEEDVVDGGAVPVAGIAFHWCCISLVESLLAVLLAVVTHLLNGDLAARVIEDRRALSLNGQALV
jgi:hypothetical protein